MISLQVKLHKTQVAAEAAVGVSKSIQLKFKLVKNKTIFTNMFISVQQQC